MSDPRESSWNTRMNKRNRDALIIDAIGGGLCKTHGKYYGYGKHGLRDCPFCDIDEYYKNLRRDDKK